MAVQDAIRIFIESLKKTGIFSAFVFSFATLFFGLKRSKVFMKAMKSSHILAKQIKGPQDDSGLILGYANVAFNHRNRLNDYLYEMTMKYGRTWHVGNYLIITTPENVEHVLKTNFDNYNKGPIFILNFHDLLGDGIFNTNGESWRFQRKTASRIFSRKAFSTFMREIFVKHGEMVLNILDKAAVNNEVIDAQHIFYKFTLDSIGQIGFGVELGCLTQERVPFADAFDHAQAHIVDRFMNPFWSIYRQYSAKEKENEKKIQIMKDFTLDVIQKRRKEGVQERMDILSFFMEKVDRNGQPFTDAYLQDIVMNFIIAGRDTTAVTLSWVFACLARYSHIQEKLLQEIDEVLQGRTPTYEDIEGNLPYLHCVVKETLRLYPPVPKDLKFAVKDDVLPDGTKVPGGTTVVYTPYVMGRLSELYANPFEFDPERWNIDENKKKNAFQFPVFQAGPRTCLGQHMAYFESKILVTMILQKYTLSLSSKQTSVTPAESVTMPIAEGLWVNVNKRTSFNFKNVREQAHL